MNNDKIYIDLKCHGCDRSDYNTKICSKCKQKYCTYECAVKIITVHNKLICTTCYVEKLK